MPPPTHHAGQRVCGAEERKSGTLRFEFVQENKTTVKTMLVGRIKYNSKACPVVAPVSVSDPVFGIVWRFAHPLPAQPLPTLPVSTSERADPPGRNGLADPPGLMEKGARPLSSHGLVPPMALLSWRETVGLPRCSPPPPSSCTHARPEQSLPLGGFSWAAGPAGPLPRQEALGRFFSHE